MQAENTIACRNVTIRSSPLKLTLFIQDSDLACSPIQSQQFWSIAVIKAMAGWCWDRFLPYRPGFFWGVVPGVSPRALT